jgi:hypothetical protein
LIDGKAQAVLVERARCRYSELNQILRCNYKRLVSCAEDIKRSVSYWAMGMVGC